MRDHSGEFVNGKRTPAVHRLRTNFDAATNQLTLQVDGVGERHTFDVDVERAELAAWLSDYFEVPLEIIENRAAGFPDDTEAPGPTLISTATLQTVGGWFGLTLDNARQRFRANLEIAGVEPFWEDHLVATNGGVVRFRIGEAELLGTNPCQRCIVPTRSPTTGEVLWGFSKSFAQHRQQTLPEWAPRDRFNHFYRLAVNTRPASATESTLRVGDELSVLGIE